MQRTVLTIVVLIAAILFAWTLGVDAPKPKDADDSTASSSAVQEPSKSDDSGDPAAKPEPTSTADTSAADPNNADAAPSTDDPKPDKPAVFPSLTAATVAKEDGASVSIGSSDSDSPYMLETQITAWGAGVKSVNLSKYSEHVKDHVPYPAQTTLTVSRGDISDKVYPMAAFEIIVNGQTIRLFDKRWKLGTASSTEANYSLDLTNPDGDTVVRLHRTYRIEEGRYDIRVDQSIENLSSWPVKAKFVQYGQGDIKAEAFFMGDRRKVTLGYWKPDYDAERQFVFTDGSDHFRTDVLDFGKNDYLWHPNDQPDQELAWAAITNRYFASVLSVPVTEGETGIRANTINSIFPRIHRATIGNGDDRRVLLVMYGAEQELTPAGGNKASVDMNLSLFTGPKADTVLVNDPAYEALGLPELIVYNMGGPCAFCTFSWLANFLIWFLTFIESGVGDWALAIIILVAVVRGLLHPLSKKSQVSMMRMGKQMQALQPEIEKIKKKYGDNQQKLNQEMMRLYQERGVSPAAGLGCLPMFLQMPIWFALYAMLFYAIELRHQPAFYGVFQSISDNWLFLADLSSQDNFYAFSSELDLWFMKISALNILPLLLGVVFYFQQKYAQPPSSGVQSEQIQMQQKMMKIMIMMFPIFMYNLPSGLNLYIFMSTLVGLIESKRIRAHIKAEEEAGKFDVQAKPAMAGGGGGGGGGGGRKQVKSQRKK